MNLSAAGLPSSVSFTVKIIFSPALKMASLELTEHSNLSVPAEMLSTPSITAAVSSFFNIIFTFPLFGWFSFYTFIC